MVIRYDLKKTKVYRDKTGQVKAQQITLVRKDKKVIGMKKVDELYKEILSRGTPT